QGSERPNNTTNSEPSEHTQKKRQQGELMVGLKRNDFVIWNSGKLKFAGKELLPYPNLEQPSLKIAAIG
ncbi:10250_t:CDS:2, partial [Paraglomus occultum]